MGTPQTDADLPGADLQEPGAAEEAARAAVQRLPAGPRRTVVRLLSRWPGRVAFRSAASCVQVEIFDRSMTIAAQFFTSVFPVLILLVTLFGGMDSRGLAGAVNLPEESRSVLDEAVRASGGATFGVVGVLIVLASATSLSRALTRSYAAIWLLPRPRSNLRSAWRWVAVVVALALSLVLVRALNGFTSGIPPEDVWQRVLAFAADVVVTVFVPWLLLSGAVAVRRLLPSGLLFASVMLAVRPASAVWLPHALEVSADRYGSIGVAFTYLAWLYVVAFCLLLAAVVGRAVTMDEGWLGGWLRGRSAV
jgi:membrane protein